MKNRLGSLANWCPNLAGDDAPRQIYAWWTAWSDTPKPNGDPKSICTRNNGLSNCKAFVNWCAAAGALTGLMQVPDIEWIRPINDEQTVKPQFTVDELARCLRMHGHPFRIRFALYLYLGARRSEALQLRWSDFEGGHVLLRGKGRKERLVPMQGELETILRIYRYQGSDHQGWLFDDTVRNDDGGNLVRRFDSFLRAAEVEKKGRSTHSLRHCYAGLMTATGEPSSLVRAYMGHTSEKMTDHYAQMAARYREDVSGWPRGQLLLLGSQPGVGNVDQVKRGAWSDEDVTWLREHWHLPPRELAQHLRRNKAAICTYGRKLGLPPRSSQ